MPFNFKRLAIPDVVLIAPRMFHDERGFFMETYKCSDFVNFGIKENFVQDNHSRSKKGALRGLHYQKFPKAQGKLVRVVVGEVFDVAEVLYKTTDEYAPDHEAGIRWNDPEIGIDWPIERPIVSAKDAELPTLRDTEDGFVYSAESLV